MEDEDEDEYNLMHSVTMFSQTYNQSYRKRTQP